MGYQLLRLAPGSYDLILAGEIVGSVVREVRDGEDSIWHAELLDDPPAEKRPHPFSKIDHTFGSLHGAVAWLGGAEIVGIDTGRSTATSTAPEISCNTSYSAA